MQVMVTDQVSLTVTKKLKTLEQQWHAFVGGHQLREVTNFSLECIKNYGLEYLLADTTHAKPLTASDLNHCTASLKEMNKVGLKHFFAVKPIFPFTQYTLLQLQRSMNGMLPVRVFETRQDAIITIQHEILNNNQLSLF